MENLEQDLEQFISKHLNKCSLISLYLKESDNVVRLLWSAPTYNFESGASIPFQIKIKMITNAIHRGEASVYRITMLSKNSPSRSIAKHFEVKIKDIQKRKKALQVANDLSLEGFNDMASSFYEIVYF